MFHPNEFGHNFHRVICSRRREGGVRAGQLGILGPSCLPKFDSIACNKPDTTKQYAGE